ncbi:hypothetical protein [Marinococcus sp. PL1-022]|uniref:LolA family protein n=1 Tax=Marinococcus sp. PL1-022 TaxID=3095363 RepID=UPI0029C5B5F3|nr:hypothetical protein [Marinococcus sp. PL1-022]MDX6154516.1 hypothetical protein [Marinococcus sp. PL1-022]
MDLDEEQENVPEGSFTTTTRETQWDYVRDGAYYNRLELDVTTEGEENGESFSEEEPTSYQFTDPEDPAYTITYDEGDEEAIRYDAGRSDEGYDMSQGAAPYEQLLEEADLTYVGEEEVNGYDTYHIQAEMNDGSSDYWFDQETYYEIKSERETSADEEQAAGDATSNMEVVDFEVNPNFDESLFQTPEDIDVVDGELEDTVGN